MKLIFLGTGSAFTLNNFQSNILIEHNEKKLLLDAGSDIRFSLQNMNLTYRDIDAVYVSHLHADHAGGIEYLGFCSYFDPTKEKITLFGSGEVLRTGWDNSWKGGLESIQGKLLSLNDFFDTKPIKPNGSFTWQGINFKIVQSVHIMNGYSIVPCYGLMIEAPAEVDGEDDSQEFKPKTIFWTADCQFCPSQIMDFYKEADFIIQDCETTDFKSGVHANFIDLSTLPEQIRKKMFLTHYQDNVVVNFEQWQQLAEKSNLKFAEKGQTIKFYDKSTYYSLT